MMCTRKSRKPRKCLEKGHAGTQTVPFILVITWAPKELF